jgi:phenylalanyl-tRNA synthetase alpha chain
LSSQTPLHPLEKKALSILLRRKAMDLEELAKESNENIDQLRRVVEWLKAKGYVDVEVKARTVITLGKEGKAIAVDGLPEARLARLLSTKGAPLPLAQLNAELKMEPATFNAALGRARQQGWINVWPTGGVLAASLRASPPTQPSEALLKKLSAGPTDEGSLTPEELRILGDLSKRPDYFAKKDEKVAFVKLLNVPADLNLETGEEVVLTASMLEGAAAGSVRLSKLDVSSSSPILPMGKEHPMATFLRLVRETLLAMGFEEVDGPLVQSSFWTFDALFTPQEHPARDMQDTFYLKDVKSTVSNPRLVNRVKRVHEDGGNLGSKGWRYHWSLSEAERSVLRTHTTAITIRYLAENSREDAKVFSLGKVFRNESANSTHLMEFNQIEGIVVEKEASTRLLMGYLSAFLKGLGFKKVTFQPSFFPYTEPSLEPQVYSEKLGKWLELGGSGVFRPEVTLPVGVKNPVMAWGFGLERLAMLYFDATDMRDFYSNRLSWLREVPQCP